MGPVTAVGLLRRAVVPPHVVFRDLDDEAVLLNLSTGVYFGLDTVGTRIWHLLLERGQLAAVRDAIVEEYDVTTDVSTADLLGFVDALARAQLVELRGA